MTILQDSDSGQVRAILDVPAIDARAVLPQDLRISEFESRGIPIQ